jgi:hypothetical protein
LESLQRLWNTLLSLVVVAAVKLAVAVAVLVVTELLVVLRSALEAPSLLLLALEARALLVGLLMHQQKGQQEMTLSFLP